MATKPHPLQEEVDILKVEVERLKRELSELLRLLLKRGLI
jgi:hypothetical protein